MNHKVNLALKITNWCNLNCAHCCERSNKQNAPYLMPIDDVYHYVVQFRDMNVPKFEHLVLTGGEVMAPYYVREEKYMSQCLDIVFENGFVPFLKTNAMWGDKDYARDMILGDLATAAYKHQKLVSLEISIDEFHNNHAQAANVVEQVIRDQQLRPAIRMALVGLNTKPAKNSFVDFMMELYKRGLWFENFDDGTMSIGVKGESRDNDVALFYDYVAPLTRVGRAAENNLGVNSVPSTTDRCLMVDNAGVATLNYHWREEIGNRTLGYVYSSLLQKIK